MKFRVASLLSLLSGIALINTPVLGMDEPRDGGGPSSHVTSKQKEVLTVKRGNLEEFLGKKNYPAAFKSLRATLPTATADGAIVDFLMTSNQYPGWTELTSEDKAWVVTKIVREAKRKGLEDFLGRQNYPAAFKSMRATLPATTADGAIIDFLMTSNKCEGWVDLDPENKAWVVAKVVNVAHRQELEALLGQQDYTRAYRSIKSFGRQASDEGAVRFLLESNGYKNWDQLSEDNRAWVVEKIKPSSLMTEGEEATLVSSFTNAVVEYRDNFRDFRTALHEYAIQKGISLNEVFFDQFNVILLVDTALTLGVPLLESLADVGEKELKFNSEDSDSLKDVVRKCINATSLFRISYYTSYLGESNFRGPLAEEFYAIRPRLETIHQQEYEAFESALKAKGFMETVMRYTVASERLLQSSYRSPGYAVAKGEMDFNYDVMLQAAKESGITTPRTEPQIKEDLYNEHLVFRPWYRMVKSAGSLPELWKQMKSNAQLKKAGASKA